MCKRRISVVIPFVSNFSFFSFGDGIRRLVLVFCVDPRWHEFHGSSLDQVVVGEVVARLCLLDDCDVRRSAPAGSQWCLRSLFRSSSQFGSCTSLLRHQPSSGKAPRKYRQVAPVYQAVYSSGKQHVRASVSRCARVRSDQVGSVPLKHAISVGAVFSSAAVYDLTVAVP